MSTGLSPVIVLTFTRIKLPEGSEGTWELLVGGQASSWVTGFLSQRDMEGHSNYLDNLAGK
jgi:hypothetical protein